MLEALAGILMQLSCRIYWLLTSWTQRWHAALCRRCYALIDCFCLEAKSLFCRIMHLLVILMVMYVIKHIALREWALMCGVSLQYFTIQMLTGCYTCALVSVPIVCDWLRKHLIPTVSIFPNIMVASHVLDCIHRYSHFEFWLRNININPYLHGQQLLIFYVTWVLGLWGWWFRYLLRANTKVLVYFVGLSGFHTTGGLVSTIFDQMYKLSFWRIICNVRGKNVVLSRAHHIYKPDLCVAHVSK